LYQHPYLRVQALQTLFATDATIDHALSEVSVELGGQKVEVSSSLID
jgi:hypothetical protein